MSYKVYFADLTHTGSGIHADHMPLGAGMVAASAAHEFKDEVEVSVFKFPERLNEALSNETPDVLCFSNYTWNTNLSLLFAGHVKKEHPDVVTVFGGPEFPMDRPGRKAFLKGRPEIDFYNKWDGEHAFVSLLRELMSNGFDVHNIKSQKMIFNNICYVLGDNYVEGPDHRVQDLMGLPSPYLMGLMDEFFEHPLVPLYEATRGCPYTCTFCNDGHALRSRIFRKTIDRIEEELEYIARRVKHSRWLSITDLNFGMFKEDIQTAQVLQSIGKRFDWPDKVDVSTGKSHPDRVLEAVKIVNEGKPGSLKLGFSFQSTDRTVLDAIKRTNLSVEQLLPLKAHRYEQIDENLPFFTEFILGLPGDTVDAHRQSLRDAVDSLGMNNVDVHQLMLLQGSEMSTPQQRNAFEPVTRYRVYVGCCGIYDVGDEQVPCGEIQEIVISNKTLSFDDYLDCRVLDLITKIFADHDPFIEVFGLIRKLNLSVFDILLDLKDRISDSNGPLSDLIDSYLAGNSRYLFNSYDEAAQYISDPENMSKYVSGEYGENELMVHRAKAQVHCSDELHQVLQEAVLASLESHGLLDLETERYIEQVVKFSRLRRFDLTNYAMAEEREFTYDFLAAADSRYEVNPSEIKVDSIRFKFAYDEAGLSVVRTLIDTVGTNSWTQIGKLFHKHNMLLTRRKVTKVDMASAAPVI